MQCSIIQNFVTFYLYNSNLQTILRALGSVGWVKFKHRLLLIQISLSIIRTHLRTTYNSKSFSSSPGVRIIKSPLYFILSFPRNVTWSMKRDLSSEIKKLRKSHFAFQHLGMQPNQLASGIFASGVIAGS